MRISRKMSESMTEEFLMETLPYSALVNSINEMLAEWVERVKAEGKPIKSFSDAGPSADVASWLLTVRADPSEKLLSALGAIQRRPAVEQLGLRVERDRNDNIARLMLAGYYEAVSRCISSIDANGCILSGTASYWEKLIEDDTPQAEALDDLIGRLFLWYDLRRKTDMGK